MNRNEAPMVDIYGYRDIDSTPFALLSPFEFIRYWDAEPLHPPSWYPDGESKTKWTSEGEVAKGKEAFLIGKRKFQGGVHFTVLEPEDVNHYYSFPADPAGKNVTWRHKWIIVRRKLPRVPVLEGVQVSSPTKSAEEKAKYFFGVFQALVPHAQFARNSSSLFTWTYACSLGIEGSSSQAQTHSFERNTFVYSDICKSFFFYTSVG